MKSRIGLTSEELREDSIAYLGEELAEKFLTNTEWDKIFQGNEIFLLIELTPREYHFYEKECLKHSSGAQNMPSSAFFYKQRHFLYFYNLEQITSYCNQFVYLLNNTKTERKYNKDLDDTATILKKILYELFVIPMDNLEEYKRNITRKQKNSVKKFVFKVLGIYILISFAVSFLMMHFYMAPVSMLVCLFSLIGWIVMEIAMARTSGIKANYALKNMRSECLEKAGCAFSLSDDVGLSLLRNHIKQRKSFGLILSSEERELLLEIVEKQCQPEREKFCFKIACNELTYKPFVLRKVYYGFKKWCMDPNTKGDAFFRINTKWKAEFFKEMLLRGLYERGFTGGIMSISGRLYVRDEGKYEISDDYTLTPEGKMLISMLNRLYE